MEKKTGKEKVSGVLYIIQRVVALLVVCAIFFPAFNPSYVFTVVDGNTMNNTTSLFTSAITSSGVVSSGIQSAITAGLLDGGPFTSLRIACVLILVGIIGAGAGACLSVGNKPMKQLSHLVSIIGAVVMLIGGILVINFYNGVEDMVHTREAAETAFEATLQLESSNKTRTLDGGHWSKTDENVYNLTITNISGQDMEGWAVEIYVGEGYDVSNVLMINKWQSILKDETVYPFNYEVQGEYLVITPGNYTLEDGELVLDETNDDSLAAEISSISAGTLQITLIADGISEDAEVICTDGAQADTMFWQFPTAVYLYIVVAILIILITLINAVLVGVAPSSEHMFMDTQYQLFLMFLPFILLIFAFSYLPLYGWRFAFVYDANKAINAEGNFAGWHWFTVLFADAAYRKLFLRVMKNTLGLSALGLLTSWLPMVFAIFLNEMKSKKFKSVVTTLTTIPNFISWVLVYAVAFAIFSADGGLINSLLGTNHNYLQDTGHLWIKMWAWGTWKGIGWSAIIYISGIAGIDQQLYEAASIDGAGRFQRMRHITFPGLLPTYVVMLVMSVAGILSNGMDQYLMFSNSFTADDLNVLDLYVYNLVFGDGGGQIPLSTVVGMGKSVISILLFFVANSAAKAIRGNGIV